MCRRTFLLVSLGFLLCVTADSARADLVAYWPMDEGSGTTVGDMTGGWDGTITGDVTWIDGHEGMALDFPGREFRQRRNRPIHDLVLLVFQRCKDF